MLCTYSVIPRPTTNKAEKEVYTKKNSMNKPKWNSEKSSGNLQKGRKNETEKRKLNKQKIKNNMANLNLDRPIITLTVNSLNTLIKIQGLSEWIKNRPNCNLTTRNSL